ncbi:MAG: 6-phosphofructokinase [Nitriliruptor sp.]|nr:MAG: 6-phosphofructokinase [Nitriliruptor sp.]
MNAAVRAVVRTALHVGVQPYLIHEGYVGMVEGGRAIVEAQSHHVGGILHRGGTAIGTARCPEFRTRDGRRTAARNLVTRDIDALVVIGGDGSLTGANLLSSEWPELLAELVEAGELEQELADAHPQLQLVGIVGSIDNDMFGTDMTVGTDTALHRITEAIDALHSTASSHQRSFVIEVMGRNCGYLALMAGLATGAQWVFIPERPPQTASWEEALRRTVLDGRKVKRRQNIVIVAEGARDRYGVSITSERVRDILAEGLGEDTRITILGHVQRGGSPSAFDRNLGTRCGYRAVQELAAGNAAEEAQLVGIRENRIVTSPLMQAVEKTQAVAGLLKEKRFDEAMELRGSGFVEAYETMRTLVRARPREADADQPAKRIAIVHGGGLAPGMNTAVRAAVRTIMDRGHTVLGIHGGLPGLRDGHVEELGWMSVSGWTSHGGAELGTKRYTPPSEDLPTIAAQIVEHELDGILMFGSFDGYNAAHTLLEARGEHPDLGIPIVCLPVTISNDVPGTGLTIGADTALNAIVEDVDKIKQSAVASTRVFVVEVMGKGSGYLALSSGLATGAEFVYTPEEGITLDRLKHDVEALNDRFRQGQRLGVIIRGEGADPVYTTPFLWALFEKEGGGLFDVRQSILGHVQQGGDPSPFDRTQATRLAVRCVDHLLGQFEQEHPESAMCGLVGGKVTFTPLSRFRELLDPDGARRPAEQVWFDSIRPIADVMSGIPVAER